MPRYFFHVTSSTNPVRDANGVELDGLNAAHWHAMHLVYRLRTSDSHADMSDDWILEVSDENGATPLVLLPSAVPLMRLAPRRQTSLRGSFSLQARGSK